MDLEMGRSNIHYYYYGQKWKEVENLIRNIKSLVIESYNITIGWFGPHEIGAIKIKTDSEIEKLLIFPFDIITTDQI